MRTNRMGLGATLLLLGVANTCWANDAFLHVNIKIRSEAEGPDKTKSTYRVKELDIANDTDKAIAVQELELRYISWNGTNAQTIYWQDGKPILAKGTLLRWEEKLVIKAKEITGLADIDSKELVGAVGGKRKTLEMRAYTGEGAWLEATNLPLPAYDDIGLYLDSGYTLEFFLDDKGGRQIDKKNAGISAEPRSTEPANGGEIHRACEAGDLEKVKALLKGNPALIGSKDNGKSFRLGINTLPAYQWTPLHWAAYAGKLEIVQLLLSNHAVVDAKESMGFTPLLLAAEQKHHDVAELLLSKGANINAKAYTGSTPLQVFVREALLAGDLDKIKVLYKSNTNLLDDRDDLNRTLLHNAAYDGQVAIVKWLLANQVDVDAKDQMGWTPLHLAAEERHKVVAELLLDNGANISARDNGGCTPLHIAAQHDSEEVAALLIAHKAEVNARNESGNTPLHLAAFATANWVHIPFEESKMRRQFGALYDDYVRRVRRWV